MKSVCEKIGVWEKCLQKVLDEYNGKRNLDALTSVGLFAVLIWHFEEGRSNHETFEFYRIRLRRCHAGSENMQEENLIYSHVFSRSFVGQVLLSVPLLLIPAALLTLKMTHIYRRPHKGYLQQHSSIIWRIVNMFVGVGICLPLIGTIPYIPCHLSHNPKEILIFPQKSNFLYTYPHTFIFEFSLSEPKIQWLKILS